MAPEDKHTYVNPTFRLGADGDPCAGPQSLRFCVEIWWATRFQATAKRDPVFDPAGHCAGIPHRGRGRLYADPLHPGPLEHIYPWAVTSPKQRAKSPGFPRMGEQVNGVWWCGSFRSSWTQRSEKSNGKPIGVSVLPAAGRSSLPFPSLPSPNDASKASSKFPLAGEIEPLFEICLSGAWMNEWSPREGQTHLRGPHLQMRSRQSMKDEKPANIYNDMYIYIYRPPLGDTPLSSDRIGYAGKWAFSVLFCSILHSKFLFPGL